MAVMPSIQCFRLLRVKFLLTHKRCYYGNIHDGRLLGLFLPEGSKSHFLAHKGVVYILNEARH